MRPVDNARTFRQIEEDRIYGLRELLFSSQACERMPLRTHLHDDDVLVNLFGPIRGSASVFFQTRSICGHSKNLWDSSTTSSQVACVNCWYPFIEHPGHLGNVLSEVFDDVAEVLPIIDELPLDSGSLPYLTFEWIDKSNRLKERGTPVRGKYVTNVDVLFRYRTTRGCIKLVLTEWKYCERYSEGCVQVSNKGTDRLAIYLPHFGSTNCQIQLPEELSPADLMYHPFDQLMRLQLLSSILQRDQEMHADQTVVLCVSPRSNLELSQSVHSTKLMNHFGVEASVYDIWKAMTQESSFCHIAIEDLVPILVRHAPTKEYSNYVALRYGGIADRMLEVNC